MSVSEIEVAIERLNPADQARLRRWLENRPLGTTSDRAKTGAELAALWPTRFHLTPQEAETLAQELDADRRIQTAPKSVAWE